MILRVIKTLFKHVLDLELFRIIKLHLSRNNDSKIQILTFDQMKIIGFDILLRIIKYKSCWTKILVNIGIIFGKRNNLWIKYQLYTRSKPRFQWPGRGI